MHSGKAKSLSKLYFFAGQQKALSGAQFWLKINSVRVDLGLSHIDMLTSPLVTCLHIFCLKAHGQLEHMLANDTNQDFVPRNQT